MIGKWSAGDSFEKEGLRLEALWPPEGLVSDENDRSLVIEARVRGLRALLCGDIESAGLRALLESRPIQAADVVLLPHHGSATDALSDLLLRARPNRALLSARAGAPAEETLRVLALFPCEVRATYLEGTISIPAE
jgi:competence protein ComEC